MAKFDCSLGVEVDDDVVIGPTVMPVPTSVSPLQIRMALRQLGFKAQVDGYVATLNEEAQEAWEFATEVRRTSPLIAMAGAGLGLTDEQVDDLFRLAATLAA